MNEDQKTKALDDVKAAMMPAIDKALTSYLGAVRDAIQSATAQETAHCIRVVELCKLNVPTSAHSSGWNEAIDFVADRLREWQKECAERGSVLSEGE